MDALRVQDRMVECCRKAGSIMTPLNREQIIALEQSDHKYVRAKKIYIDMAGDLIAGIVLSEVVYWHTPGKGGKQRLRTIEGESDKWLACRRQGWWERARITARQFDRALDKLVKCGLIVRQLFDYKGQSTLHVRINWVTFETLYNALLEKPAPRKRRVGVTKQQHPEKVLPNGDTLSPDGNTDLPNGDTESPHGDTYTIIDTTIDTKTENNTLPIAKSELDLQFDSISETWNNKAGGWVSNMQGMMFGSKKVRGAWKECEFNPPATVDEVNAFGSYGKKRSKDGKLPTSPDTIQRWFYDFRAENAKKLIKLDAPPVDLTQWETPDPFAFLESEGA